MRAYKSVAAIAETFVFVYLGMAMLSNPNPNPHPHPHPSPHPSPNPNPHPRQADPSSLATKTLRRLGFPADMESLRSLGAEDPAHLPI